MPNSFRHTNGPGQDKTFRTKTQSDLEVDYAATIDLLPTEDLTQVKVGQLTGGVTITAGTTDPYIGDKLELIFSADATNRTVTLGTGFAATAATIVVTASKKATASFVFDGAQWVEQSRAITV